MIRFYCQCGRQLQASENYIGQPAVCPMCGQTNVVPATDSPPKGTRINDRGEILRPEDRPDFQPPPKPAPSVARYRQDEPDEDAPPYRQSFAPQGSCQDAQTALILGLVGVFCCAICCPLAIVYGIRALNQINASHGRLSGHGMAVAGLVIGIIGTLWVGIILLLAFADAF